MIRFTKSSYDNKDYTKSLYTQSPIFFEKKIVYFSPNFQIFHSFPTFPCLNYPVLSVLNNRQLLKPEAYIHIYIYIYIYIYIIYIYIYYMPMNHARKIIKKLLSQSKENGKIKSAFRYIIKQR